VASQVGEVTLSTIRDKINDKRDSYARLLGQYKDEGVTLKQARQKLEDAEKARVLIQEVAQDIQQKAHHQIAAVVTRGLQTVFDEPYTFQIHFEKKRGRTEARFKFERDGLELDPLTASGGGVVDVAAFTLRLACIALSKPAVRKVLILDEPFKNVSERKSYLEKIPELLDALCRDLGVQVVMVTNLKELEIGKVIDVEELSK